MKPTTGLLILATALLTACGRDGLEPQGGALRLEGTIGRSTIGVGDTTSLVFRLRNLSRDSITLSFSTSCQVLPYITTRRADQVVHPRGGAWGCYQVVTSLTLAPGAENVTRILVSGGAQGSYPAVPLLPGKYQAYARLEHPDAPLRSATIAFSVVGVGG